jgi:hypothetical protein
VSNADFTSKSADGAPGPSRSNILSEYPRQRRHELELRQATFAESLGSLMRNEVMFVIRMSLVLRVRLFAAFPGFRRPTLPPVASACRAAVRKVKIENAVLISTKGSHPRPFDR